MKRTTRILLIGAFVIVVIAGAAGLAALFSSGVTRRADEKFADQHLKTAVALIELHRVRNETYPASLDDLRFVGDWDRIALGAVSYQTNAERSRYCVVVERGWVGRPNLKMPAEFWQGTGYDPTVCR